MTWSLIVQEKPAPAPPPHAPAPFLIILATVTLVLMMFRRYVYLQANRRGAGMAEPPVNSSSDPSDSLPREDVDRLDANLAPVGFSAVCYGSL